MKSFLRHKLELLRDSYQNDTIPWDIMQTYPSAEKLIIEMILGKTAHIISDAMDYPEVPRNSGVYRNITEIFEENEIDPLQLWLHERESLVLIAAYEICRIIIAKGYTGHITRYMRTELPVHYIREVMKELGINRKTDLPESVTDTRDDCGDECYLPESPEIYKAKVKEIGVGEYTKTYSFYNRTHLYRILNRTTPGEQDS